jgi:integral membrane protein (TIGR01906 family)
MPKLNTSLKLLIYIPIFLVLNLTGIVFSINNLFPNFYYSVVDNSSSKLTIEVKIDYAKLTADFIHPLVSNDDESTINIFTDLEIDHLVDVRKILQNILFVYFLSIISLVIISFHVYRKKKVEKYLLIINKATKLNIIATFLAGCFIFIFWNYFFIKFHEIFFPQGNWSFPANSMLIQLYPAQFWIFYTIFIIIINLSLSEIILIGTKYYLHRSNRVDEK